MLSDDFPTVEDRIQICLVHTFLRISAENHHPLHKKITQIKGNQLTRGNSWMGLAEDVIQQVCSLLWTLNLVQNGR